MELLFKYELYQLIFIHFYKCSANFILLGNVDMEIGAILIMRMLMSIKKKRKKSEAEVVVVPIIHLIQVTHFQNLITKKKKLKEKPK